MSHLYQNQTLLELNAAQLGHLRKTKNENLILNLLKVPCNDLTAGKPLPHMLSRISYFVIYSPNYIETTRHGNFYLGSMSALSQQLRHCYSCYFKTGDTKEIFGAVTLWPHIHTCWCRTKVCSAGVHTFCSALTCWGPQGTFIMPVQDSLSLSVLPWCVYDQSKWWKEWKVPTCNTHSSTFSSRLSLPCGKSSST